MHCTCFNKFKDGRLLPAAHTLSEGVGRSQEHLGSLKTNQVIGRNQTPGLLSSVWALLVFVSGFDQCVSVEAATHQSDAVVWGLPLRGRSEITCSNSRRELLELFFLNFDLATQYWWHLNEVFGELVKPYSHLSLSVDMGCLWWKTRTRLKGMKYQGHGDYGHAGAYWSKQKYAKNKGE